MVPNTWSSTLLLGNIFQINIFPHPAMSNQPSPILSSVLTTPPQPPPRNGFPKDILSDAFTILDPLGDKEVKEVKETCKDLHYFNSKIGTPQAHLEHDNFDASQLLNKIDESPKRAPTQSAFSVTKSTENIFENPLSKGCFSLSQPSVVPACPASSD
ncbi:hypothetical protein A6R68_04373, partial [Neotoma lepida]